MLTIAAVILTALYILDRITKTALVASFFARMLPPAPKTWPSVALIQPVTSGATNLAENLSARAALDYPGAIRHLIVCDAKDFASQAVCITTLPTAELILVEPDLPHAPIATKVAKMAAGAAHLGNSDVVCFVDDDILLPPDAMQLLAAPLYATTPEGSKPAGATFGLACQMSWSTVWESLMSGFVNANALTGYVPLTFFTEPYTITGHIFALRRTVFEQTGGMSGLAQRFDDDHEIARRVRALGFSAVQTPLVYGVSNALPSLPAYQAQLRRWFVMPRQSMAHYLTPREQAVSLLLSLGNLFPPTILLCSVCFPSKMLLACVLLTLATFFVCYVGLEQRYLPARTPLHRWLLLPFVAFITPLHILAILLFPSDRILWRGQFYQAQKGGGLEPSGNSPPSPQ